MMQAFTPLKIKKARSIRLNETIQLIKKEKKRRKQFRKQFTKYVSVIMTPLVPKVIGLNIGEFVNVKIPIPEKTNTKMKMIRSKKLRHFVEA